MDAIVKVGENSYTLKPCPSCGSAPVMLTNLGYFIAHCSNPDCDRHVFELYDSAEACCKAWNEKK